MDRTCCLLRASQPAAHKNGAKNNSIIGKEWGISNRGGFVKGPFLIFTDLNLVV